MSKVAQEIKNSLKKELYKQKPTAFFVGRGKGVEAFVHGFHDKVEDSDEGDYFYRAMVNIDGDLDIFFRIPEGEMLNEEGNKILNKKEPAQLLIRWLV